MFTDLHLTDKQAKKKSGLIDCTSFAAKELFYNSSIQRQIDRLGELLTPEHFAESQPSVCVRALHISSTVRRKRATLREMAYQLARRMECDLMVVDVSQIKRCWVGKSDKSEKNISEAFSSGCSSTRLSLRNLPQRRRAGSGGR